MAKTLRHRLDTPALREWCAECSRQPRDGCANAVADRTPTRWPNEAGVQFLRKARLGKHVLDHGSVLALGGLTGQPNQRALFLFGSSGMSLSVSACANDCADLKATWPVSPAHP
jgi:hypothetical protein